MDIYFPSIVYSTSNTITTSTENSQCFYGLLQFNGAAWSMCSGLVFTAFHESKMFIPWFFGTLGIVAGMLAAYLEREKSEEYKELVESLFTQKQKIIDLLSTKKRSK